LLAGGKAEQYQDPRDDLKEFKERREKLIQESLSNKGIYKIFGEVAKNG